MKWAVGGAIEHGAFLMAAATLFLSGIGVLLVISGVIAYIKIKGSAKKLAKQEALKVSQKIAEREANLYLQRELPNIIQEYMELSRNAVSYDDGDRIATAKSEDI